MIQPLSSWKTLPFEIKFKDKNSPLRNPPGLLFDIGKILGLVRESLDVKDFICSGEPLATIWLHLRHDMVPKSQVFGRDSTRAKFSLQKSAGFALWYRRNPRTCDRIFGCERCYMLWRTSGNDLTSFEAWYGAKIPSFRTRFHSRKIWRIWSKRGFPGNINFILMVPDFMDMLRMYLRRNLHPILSRFAADFAAEFGQDLGRNCVKT